MEGCVHDYMRVGLIHFMAYPDAGGEGERALETIRRIALDPYFDAIAIAWIKNSTIRAQAKEILKTSKVTTVFGAHPRLLGGGLNLNASNQSERKKAIEAMEEEIDRAIEMNAASCVFLSGPYDSAQVENGLDLLVDSTRELCAWAKRCGGLTLAAEVFDHTIDKKSLIGPAGLARRYAERICSEFDNFGLVVDLSHIPLIGETPEEAILPVKDYLLAVDIGNCVRRNQSDPRYGDKHPRFGYPGGENDVEEVVGFLRVLLEIGFLNRRDRPIVSFEVKPGDGEDPDAVVANAKRTLNRAWSLL